MDVGYWSVFAATHLQSPQPATAAAAAASYCRCYCPLPPCLLALLAEGLALIISCIIMLTYYI